MPALKRFRAACLLFEAACIDGRRVMSHRLRGLVLGSLLMHNCVPRGWGCYIYSTRPCCRGGIARPPRYDRPSPVLRATSLVLPPQDREPVRGPRFHLWAPSRCYVMAFRAAVVHERVALSGARGGRPAACPWYSGSGGTWTELWGAEGAPMSAQAAPSI
ncbi:hypothetical protein NDU88_008673 [Pleurodeles waltl]|uniref:Uncharacterized protein n=1 Tax=Pleurodeles waltl TaxID=8319 RepID=A0AAV7RVF9_PLEWA|nr:hypothetical protein NDU88_008673 [Pleurodeles waltl]